MRFLLVLPVRLYQRLISPCKPRCCRFQPTCSSYAIEALRVHGAVRGCWLALRRILRCHPFCAPGYDPVPPPRAVRPTPTAPPATDRPRPH
jgi:putative membrane protein insertion efficiency factor